MSSHCSRGRWQAGVALAAPTVAEARCGHRHAAKSSVGGAVGYQGGLARCCEVVSAWRGAAERAKTRGQCVGSGAVRAIRALWARPVHALGVLDEMPEHATELG